MPTQSTTVAAQPAVEISADGLHLERLPSGELAWLRPTPRERAYVIPSRYWLTDKGRRALALHALFGRPWPTVAHTAATDRAAADC